MDNLPEDSHSPAKSRVRDLFVWQSLSRPTLNYPKGTFVSLASILAFLSVLFVLFQEWLAIVVSWAAYFLFYALTKIPQTMVEHKITTQGIVTLGQSYIWPELGPFWFTTRGAETILHIAHRGIWGHLTMLISPSDEDKIRDSLAEYLPFIETPEKTTLDKFQDWFALVILREKR